MKVKFKEWNCILEKAEYSVNKSVALSLYDEEDHCPVAVATVCIPELKVPEGYVIIKDYSENEGMYEALVEQGVVAKAEFRAKINHNLTVPVCKLLI